MTENKNPEIRKAEILAAALKRFTAGGYYKTAIDDIAADVGITKAGVYYYFKSKKNLFCEIFRIKVDRYLEDLAASIADSDHAEEKLRRLTVRSGQLLPQHTEILKFCLEFFSQGMRDSDIRKEVTLLCEKRIAASRAIITDGIKAGRFKRIDPESAARSLLFLSMGFFLVHFSSNIALDPAAQQAMDMKTLLDGIRK
jgi:AcrR family transcriptional regulator